MFPTIEPFAGESQPPDSAFFQSPAGGLILIRTTQQNSECLQSKAPLMKAINPVTKQVVYFRPACHKWDCPVCGEKNAYKARLRALTGYETLSDQGRKFDFLTLTPHEKLTSSASIPVMAKAWNKLSVRIKRASQHHDYFLIPELHQSGKLHFHALVSAQLKKKWWKDNGRSCGMGYQNDLQEVNEVGGVGGYLTKYLTKMLQNSNLPKGFRRIRASYTWPSLPELDKPEGWIFVTLGKKAVISDEIKIYQETGHTIVMADANSAWGWIDLWT